MCIGARRHLADLRAFDRARDPTDEEWLKIFDGRSLLKGFGAEVFSGKKISYSGCPGRSCTPLPNSCQRTSLTWQGPCLASAFNPPKTFTFDKPGVIGIEHMTIDSKQQEDRMAQGLGKKEMEAKA